MLKLKESMLFMFCNLQTTVFGVQMERIYEYIGSKIHITA